MLLIISRYAGVFLRNTLKPSVLSLTECHSFLTPFLPQLFLKGRRIRAAVVDEAIHGPDPFTPEEFASEYQVPLEAVREALEYVAQNRPLIEQERDHEAARLRARGLGGPTQG